MSKHCIIVLISMFSITHSNGAFASDMGAIANALAIVAVSFLLCLQTLIVAILYFCKFFKTKKPFLSYVVTSLLVGFGTLNFILLGRSFSRELGFLLYFLPAIPAILIPWWQFRNSDYAKGLFGKTPHKNSKRNISATKDSYTNISEFSKYKDIPESKVIEMIKDGFYVGRIFGEEWYIHNSELDG